LNRSLDGQCMLSLSWPPLSMLEKRGQRRKKRAVWMSGRTTGISRQWRVNTEQGKRAHGNGWYRGDPLQSTKTQITQRTEKKVFKGKDRRPQGPLKPFTQNSSWGTQPIWFWNIHVCWEAHLWTPEDSGVYAPDIVTIDNACWSVAPVARLFRRSGGWQLIQQKGVCAI
jgi:hypothetical protein